MSDIVQRFEEGDLVKVDKRKQVYEIVAFDRFSDGVRYAVLRALGTVVEKSATLDRLTKVA